MEKQFDLISIGDASIDVFLTPIESEALCRIDTKECYIAFSFGDKIPVKNLEFTVGGNAANNAVGCERLGVETAIVLTLGDDDIGEQIVNKLKIEGVDLSFITKQKSSVSNYSTVISYGGERTLFTYHAPRSYEFPPNLPQVGWIYLTSMGEEFRPFYKSVAEWIRENPKTRLAFNPGSWQLKGGVEAISNILSLTTAIFVNREEAEKITGQETPPGKERELLIELSKLGPKICVITDGGKGSFIYDGNRFVHAGVLPVDAYERTGAGDAFGSGCLSALIKGKSLEEALVWGTVNSASVIGYVGPQKGLIQEKDISTWLERYKSSKVEVEEF